MNAHDLEQGLDAGLAARPDLICFTGDFVSHTSGFDAPGLRRLLRRAADAAPAFAVLGNHDGGRWLTTRGGESSTAMMRGLISSTGVTMLHNEAAEVRGLCLAGTGDLWSGDFHPDRAFAGQTAAPTIVLCHNPDAKRDLRPYRWDLMLSGHTHGGQARLPGIKPAWIPVEDKRFVAGLYRWDERQLFISRGLGSPKHVRLFCRPEVSILDLA